MAPFAVSLLQDWRKRVEQQRGAVLATETKNNKFKVARWTTAAILAGAEIMKLGYVTRVTPKDNSNHVLLGTQVQKPKDFASQMTLSMDNGWGIVRVLLDLLLRQPEGQYLLLKVSLCSESRKRSCVVCMCARTLPRS